MKSAKLRMAVKCGFRSSEGSSFVRQAGEIMTAFDARVDVIGRICIKPRSIDYPGWLPVAFVDDFARVEQPGWTPVGDIWHLFTPSPFLLSKAVFDKATKATHGQRQWMEECDSRLGVLGWLLFALLCVLVLPVYLAAVALADVHFSLLGSASIDAEPDAKEKSDDDEEEGVDLGKLFPAIVVPLVIFVLFIVGIVMAQSGDWLALCFCIPFALAAGLRARKKQKLPSLKNRVRLLTAQTVFWWRSMA